MRSHYNRSCTNTSLQVDLKELASLGNYKTTASANSCWYTLKNKLQSKKGEALNLTPADHKLLALVWQCFDSVPKVNVKLLAKVGGYKTAASANSCWYSLKKKLSSAEGGSGEKKGGVSAKRSIMKREIDGVERQSSSTPKKRNSGRSAKVMHEQEAVAEELEIDVVIVKKEEGEDKVEAEAAQPWLSSQASPMETLKVNGPHVSEDEEEGVGTTAITAEVEGCSTKVKREEEEVAKEFVEQMMRFAQ